MQINEYAPSYIRSISPYLPGKPISELAREYNLNESAIIKMASNENPLGASPKALEVIEQMISNLARYPDGNGYDLKEVIKQKHAVPHEQIILGNGSNEILELIAKTFLTPGTSSVFSQYSFAVYALSTKAAGAESIEVPAKDFGHDLDAMLTAIRPDTRVVYITNPNNPTGTMLTEFSLNKFMKAVPGHVLVVLDEAYTEYLPSEHSSHTIQWVENHSNLIVLRTFSKAYGLAGLRIGYGVGFKAVIDLLNRVRQPFNVNSLALAAATAAINDNEFISRAVHYNNEGMQLITCAFKRLGLDYIPSYANFVLFHVKDGATINEYLLQRGVIVRPLVSYGLPDSLRVTIGKPDENLRFISVLERALQAQ